jgi:hypothetical protein
VAKDPFYMEPPSSFETIPAGDHDAVIVAVFDVGKQEVDYGDGPKWQPQFVVAVELGIAKADGTPHYMLSKFSRGWFPGAYWRQMCERVMQHEFGDDESFDSRNLLGKHCTAVVTNQTQSRGRYENVYSNLEVINEPGSSNHLVPACEPFVWSIATYAGPDAKPLPDHAWIDDCRVYGKTLADLVREGVLNADKVNPKQTPQAREPQRSAPRSAPDQYTRGSGSSRSVPEDDDDSDIPFACPRFLDGSQYPA